MSWPSAASSWGIRRRRALPRRRLYLKPLAGSRHNPGHPSVARHNDRRHRPTRRRAGRQGLDPQRSMLNKRLISTVLLATAGSFFLVGVVLLALGLHWAFWAPAFTVASLDLMAALLFLRSQ
jgi:hypothetical protein